MPEGDTIDRAARALPRALAGKLVTGFRSTYPLLTRFHDDTPLTGQIVESVESGGKWLLIHFSGGATLVTHMLMSGSCRSRIPEGAGGFTGCGKTRFGGRRGFQPPHNARRINAGFSRGGTLSSNFTGNPAFFRSRFNPLKQSKFASLPGRAFATVADSRFSDGARASHAAEKTRFGGNRGFIRCGKTRFGGRRGFQPPHNARRINAGFSRGETLSANFKKNRNGSS